MNLETTFYNLFSNKTHTSEFKTSKVIIFMFVLQLLLKVILSHGLILNLY